MEKGIGLNYKVIKEAEDKVLSLGRKPIFIYNLHTPHESFYKGEMIDDIAERIIPGFDRRFHEAWLVHESWRKQLEKKEV